MLTESEVLGAAYTNPFEVTDLDAIKYPVYPNPHARTYRSYLRCAPVADQTNGFAQVLIGPACMSVNDPTNTSTGEDFACLYSVGGISQNQYVSNTTSLVSAADSDSFFEKADFGSAFDDNRYRIICAGVRIRYSGREDEMSGTYYLTNRATHETLIGAGPSDLAQLPETHIVPVDKEWHMVSTYPATPLNDDYLTDHTGAYVTGAGWSMCLGICVQGCETQAKFEAEAVCIFEVLGPKANVGTGPAEIIPGADHVSALGDHLVRERQLGSRAYLGVSGGLGRLSRRSLLEHASLARASGNGTEQKLSNAAAAAIANSNLPFAGDVAALIRNKKVRRRIKRGARKVFRKVKHIF
jgi:hypothetical protein